MPSSEIASDTLAITLFGPMQVRVQGLPLPPLRSRKPLWLLALLTLRPNRPVEREWLAGTLWPDVEQSKAFANLRPVLSELRTSLATEGKRVQSPDRHTLMLDLTDAEVDLLRFDAAIKSGKLSSLEQAVALYCGPLLEGCNEEWVPQEREAREQGYLLALQKLGDVSVAGGDYAAAAGYYQQVVRIDPWREAARRGWMEALSRNGDTNSALQVYREFVAFLKEDPKAVPDEQTSALYERLRAQVRQRAGTHAVVTAETASVPVVKGYLPHALTELVGREDERLEVAIQLRRSRLVTLTGVGGIGKTRLAREVASEVVREYADGVWLVALEALSEGQLVVQQLASVLGLREERGRTLLQSVTEHLRRKRLLLVLDNCEHLLAASAQVAAHLLVECAQVRILATSREALGIAGETVWSVPALAVPETRHLPQGQATLLRVLMGYESVQLFVERAQAVQKGFALSGSNARRVAQACHRLEGIPLAIELAAARVRAMSVEQIASRLEDTLGLLTAGSRTAQSRQQTLRATLDWSYALLSEGERCVLRRLSVFSGGSLLEAAEGVCSGEGIEAGQVLDLLSSLVDKSLVQFEERESYEGRYRLLDMVRQYAAEGLQASGEAEQVRTRHRDWYLAFAEAAEPELIGPDQARWIDRLQTELDNLCAAIEWCETEEANAGTHLRLVGALSHFWDVRGYLDLGRGYLTKALGRAEASAPTAERAKALQGAGLLAHRRGDYPSAFQGDDASARTLYEESLVIYRELGDRGGIAHSLSSLGYVAYSQDDYDAARTLLQESLAMSRELGDRRSISFSLNILGIVASSQGDNGAARALHEESLAIRRELGDKPSIAWSLYQLGNVAVDQGDYDAARTLLQESLTLYREMGHTFILHVLGALGHVERNVGDYGRASAHYRESLLLRRELEDAHEQAVTIACSLEDFAGLAGRQGQWERAVRLLGAAATLAGTLGRTLPVAIAAEYERTVADAHAALNEEEFAAAREEGRALTLEQAIAYALELESVSPTH